MLTGWFIYVGRYAHIGFYILVIAFERMLHPAWIMQGLAGEGRVGFGLVCG